MSDLRYALRALRKSPGFTTVATLSLALGIGANTAIYSAMRAVLFDTLPIRAPHEIVELGWTSGTGARTGIMTIGSTGFGQSRSGANYRSTFSYSLYQAFQQARTADVFAFSYAVTDVSVSLGGEAVAASSLLVSGSFFRVLDVPPAFGRTLTESDDRISAEPAAVITHTFWMRAFGGNPDVLGRSVRLNGAAFTIVGVMPPEFFGISRGGFFAPSDVIMPLSAHPLVYTRVPPASRSLFAADDRWWVRVMARVPPDAAEQAAAELRAIFSRSMSSWPISRAQRTPAWDLQLFPAAKGVDVLTDGMRQPLLILGGVVAIVLLIACANVGNLMLARGAARQKEMAIRLALGSGRSRLVRAIAVESGVLALAGGVIGVIVGVWGARALLLALPVGSGKTALDVSLDVRLLGVTTAISAFAALLFGLAPALATASGAIAPSMKRVAVGANERTLDAGKLLMTAQVAISLPLLVGALLLLKTVSNLGIVDLGFNPDRLSIVRLDPGLNGYDAERIERFYTQVLQRLQTVPGVAAATLSDVVLLSRVQNDSSFVVPGGEPKNIKFARVGPQYFETMSIPVIGGRTIANTDHSRAPAVAVLNESAARALFGPETTIGGRFTMQSRPPVDFEVVGIVKDSRYTSPRDPMAATIYLPYAQTALGRFGPMNVIVRASGPAAFLDAPIRSAIAVVDRDVPIIDASTQTQYINQTLGTERTFMRLLMLFGGFALLLASIGLHGVTAYSVTRRTSEIGVRVALGAKRADVLWLVFRQVAVIAAAGLMIGIPAAIAAARLLRTILYGVAPGDPLSVGAAALVMVTVAAIAGYLPARRAAALDPLVALREE